MDLAFRYAEQTPLETEADYPYIAAYQPCAYDQSKGVGRVYNYHDVKANDPEQLKAAIALGPVSVGIEADQPVFHNYAGGVITSSDCG